MRQCLLPKRWTGHGRDFTQAVWVAAWARRHTTEEANRPQAKRLQRRMPTRVIVLQATNGLELMVHLFDDALSLAKPFIRTHTGQHFGRLISIVEEEPLCRLNDLVVLQVISPFWDRAVQVREVVRHGDVRSEVKG